MKFWIALEGREAEVEVTAEGERVWLAFEGRRLLADFRRLPDGEVYSLIMDGKQHVVRVVTAGGSLEVTVGGTMIPVDVRHPLEKLMQSAHGATGATAGETVQSPMPGLVVGIKVHAGETVVAGQAVAVIEAMKMQNELTARHGGIVTEVLVKAGDSVSTNQALLRMKAATT